MKKFKKSILSLVIASLVITSNPAGQIVFADPEDMVEINETNFPDPVFREYIKTGKDNWTNEYIDKNRDGFLSQAELDAVQSIDIGTGEAHMDNGVYHNGGAASIKGIELFGNLISFGAFGNSITSADFSGNPNLEVLGISGNPLEGLIINNNKKLAYLTFELFGAPIDLTPNTNLVSIGITMNNVEELNFTGIDSLKELTVFGDRIIRINVAYNNNLERLELHCPNMPSVGVGNNLKLKKLNIFDTNIDEIDVRNNNLIDTLVTTTPGVYVNDYRKCIQFGDEFGHVDEQSYEWIEGPFLCINTKTTVIASGDVTMPEIPAPTKIYEINEENFPDANFRQYISDELDTTPDGWLDEEELKEATSLNPYNRNIESLEGIDKFYNARYLYAGGNRLSDIYLGGNTALEVVNLEGNNLTSLDLSENVNLNRLDCSYNDLESLDVSSNNKLEFLDCSLNYLTELKINDNLQILNIQLNDELEEIDLSGKSNLVYLNGSYTAMSTIDLSDCTSLKCIRLDETFIGEVDVTNCPILDNLVTTQEGKRIANHNNKPVIMFGNEPEDIYSPDVICEMLKVDLGVTVTASGPVSIEKPVIVVDINEDNFPDPAFRAVIGEYDIDGDGGLAQYEIDSIGELFAFNDGIESLEGIDYLTNLTAIFVGQNNINNADFSGLTNLRAIWLNDCGLETIILPATDNLEELNVINNELTSISFPGAIPPRLYINGNNIEEIDVRGSAIETLLATGIEPDDIGRAWNYETEDGSVRFSFNKSTTVISDGYDQPEDTGYLGIEISDRNFPDPAFEEFISATYDKDGNFFLSDEEIDDAKSMIIPDSYRNRILDLGGIEYLRNLEEIDCHGMGLPYIPVGSTVPKLKRLICYGNNAENAYIPLSPNITDAVLDKGGTYSESNGIATYSHGDNMLVCDKNLGLWIYEDMENPQIGLNATNNLASSQNVTVTVNDRYKTKGYYFGRNSDVKTNQFVVTCAETSSVTVNASGTYYFAAENAAGLLSDTAQITFVKTTLDANGGKVNPQSVITEKGKSFTLPVPTRSGYTFNGWAESKTATSGNITTVSPVSDKTYYATWKSNTPEPTIPAVPKLVATYNGAKGIGVQWEKSEGATSYDIWKKYQGKWSKIKTISATDKSLQFSGNKIMYTDTTVRSNYGQGYIYSVAASNKAGTSKYNTIGLAAYRLINPEITKVTANGGGKVTVNWSKVTCQGYEVQYATEADAKKDKWTKCKEVKYGKNSQVISGLKKGQKYVLRIRCEKTNKDRGTTWSQYSGWKSVTVK